MCTPPTTIQVVGVCIFVVVARVHLSLAVIDLQTTDIEFILQASSTKKKIAEIELINNLR